MTEPRELSYRKGEIIYRQGQYEMLLYDILYGSVALYQNYGEKNELLVKTYHDEGYFGEIELVEARPRTTTAVALGPVRAMAYDSACFSELFRRKPAMVVSVMQQMGARIRELQREYNDACRVAAESLAAEKLGREKGVRLQSERKKLSDHYRDFFLHGGKPEA